MASITVLEPKNLNVEIDETNKPLIDALAAAEGTAEAMSRVQDFLDNVFDDPKRWIHLSPAMGKMLSDQTSYLNNCCISPLVEYMNSMAQKGGV